MDSAAMRLVYQNLANGVAAEDQARALGCSVEEVERVFKETGLALASWMLEETVPYVPCQSVESARQNRRVLLPMLDGVDPAAPIKWQRVRAVRCRVES